VTAAPPIKILTACAEKYALQCAFGEMDIQDAVDGLHAYAERSDLVAELGQDRVQDIIAAAFIWASEIIDAEGDDTIGPGYAADIVRQWELADARDRWRHTGEAPPAAVEMLPAAKPTYTTPQSVVDAFWCVMQSGDADYLSRWLIDHPLDASHLKKVWEAKCSTAAA
jgi:hypothetical protein